jgi:hypothetical protein
MAPAPDSDLTRWIQAAMKPYVSLFQLKHPWNFFTPEVGLGYEIRYTILDLNGEKHTFNPTEGLDWYHPAFWWHRKWQKQIALFPEAYAERMLEILCKRHRMLRPASITVSIINQQQMSPADFLAGMRPFELDWASEGPLVQASCE